MAANGALAEDDQAARQDVGAFHGDGHRHLLVGAAEEVRGAEADALAAEDVHAVVHRLAGALGDVVLDDGGDHRGLLAEVDRAGGHDAGGVAQVQVAAQARQRLLDALELADRRLELVAHAGVAADGAHRQLLHAGVGGRQRDRAAGGEALHQHAPALAGHLRPADDELERHEDVLAARRAVVPGGVEREVAAAGLDAGMVRRHQGAGDADVVHLAEQVLGVEQAEGEADHRGDRRQRDVALVPGDAHADDFLALPHAAANDALVGDRCGVRAGPGAGQREAGNVEALGEARQVMILLFLGAVVQQQLGRAEGVRHHHRHRRGGAARGEFRHHLRVGVGGEADAAVLLRDDHAEETLLLEAFPGFRREVVIIVRGDPVVGEAAQFLGLVVERTALPR